MGQNPETSGCESGTQLKAALDKLAQALSGKQVEPICAGYQQLRSAGAGMKVGDLLSLAQSCAGEEAVAFTVVTNAGSAREGVLFP